MAYCRPFIISNTELIRKAWIKMDENLGIGGSYIIDKKTGKRVLVERTAESNETENLIKPTKKDKTADKELNDA